MTPAEQGAAAPEAARPGPLLARLPRSPLPNPRQAAMLVLVALSVGIVSGRALEGGADEAPSARLALSNPAPAAKPDADASTAPAEGSGTLSAPAGNVAAEPAPPSPAAPSAPALAAPPEPVVEPSVPLEEEPVAPGPGGDQPAGESPGEPEGDEQAIEVEGTVVRVNPATQGYVLATAPGELIAVHAERLPEPGERFEARLTKLANGTTRELERKATGSKAAAKLRGTITFVAPGAAGYVVSARGASLLVRSAPDRVQPKLRDLVTASVRLEPGDGGETDPARLVEESLEVEGEATGAVDLAGTVQAFDSATRLLTLSADDLRESERDIVISVAPDLDTTPFKSGRAIVATVEIPAEGSYRLVTAYADDDARRADQAGPGD